MKYPYLVKFNGVWYEPGEEVPEKEETKELPPVEEPKKRGRRAKTEE